MLKYRTALILLLPFFLISCATTSGGDDQVPLGEKLIFYFDETIEGFNDWQISKKEDKDYIGMMWQHPQRGFDDSFVLSVYFNPDFNMASFRETQDKPGYEKCDKFSTQIVSQDDINNYPAMLWKTQCLRNGKVAAQAIQLVVVGNNTFYHMQKIWRVSISDKTFNKWLDGFHDVVLCDDRNSRHQCPG